MADDLLLIGAIIAVGAYVTNMLCQPFNLCFNGLPSAPSAPAPTTSTASQYPTATSYAGYAAHMTVA